MNIVEKILAAKCGRAKVNPGELVVARVDLILGNELSAIVALEVFEQLGAEKVKDPDLIALVPDHFTPAKDVRTAELCRTIRAFVKRHGIRNYFEVGRAGIEHCVLPENGLVKPGMLIIGGDSHTCTYGAFGAFGTGVGSTDMAAAFVTGEFWMRVPETLNISYHGRPASRWVVGKDYILHTLRELTVQGALNKAIVFTGEGLDHLDLASRLTITNMSVELGAKAGLMEPNQETLAWLAGVAQGPFEVVRSDPDASYSQAVALSVEGLEPLVARPSSPDNVVPVSEAEGAKLDQVLIGSCTNGRLEDLRVTARLLAGHRVHPDVRLLVLPGTQKIYLQALREGLLETLVMAGAAVNTPGCGPCIGGHLGVLAAGEVCFSTTSRNFAGRMGHREAQVYLGSPAIGAASAVAGELVHPDRVAGAVATSVSTSA